MDIYKSLNNNIGTVMKNPDMCKHAVKKLSYILRQNRVADIYIKLKSITSKLHNMSASIAFIKKALFVDVIPKFATVKGPFINETDSLTASRKLMKSDLTKLNQDLYNLLMTI